MHGPRPPSPSQPVDLALGVLPGLHLPPFFNFAASNSQIVKLILLAPLREAPVHHQPATLTLWRASHNVEAKSGPTTSHQKNYRLLFCLSMSSPQISLSYSIAYYDNVNDTLSYTMQIYHLLVPANRR